MKHDKSMPFPPRYAAAYDQLPKNPLCEAMLHRHIKRILDWADEQKSDQAATLVVDAAVKAIVDFDLEKAEWAWIAKHGYWALITHSRMFRPGAVRDAYRSFVAENHYGPSLKQLAKAANLSPREVLAVWHLVAAELEIDASKDTVILSLPPSSASSLRSSLDFESLHEFFERSTDLDMLDYSLIVLTHLLGKSTREVKLFADDLREVRAEGGSVADFRAELSDFAGQYRDSLGIEWTNDWFEIKTEGQIRIRIHRAKKRLREYRDSGPTQSFAA